MRIFWYQGGLQVQPEGAAETKVLADLVNSVKVGFPPGMQASRDKAGESHAKPAS